MKPRVLAQLKQYFQDRQCWPELVAVWQKETMVMTGDAITLAKQYREIAEIYRHRLDDLAKAIWYYEQAGCVLPIRRRF